MRLYGFITLLLVTIPLQSRAECSVLEFLATSNQFPSQFIDGMEKLCGPTCMAYIIHSAKYSFGERGSRKNVEAMIRSAIHALKSGEVTGRPVDIETYEWNTWNLPSIGRWMFENELRKMDIPREDIMFSIDWTGGGMRQMAVLGKGEYLLMAMAPLNEDGFGQGHWVILNKMDHQEVEIIDPALPLGVRKFPYKLDYVKGLETFAIQYESVLYYVKSTILFRIEKFSQ